MESISSDGNWGLPQVNRTRERQCCKRRDIPPHHCAPCRKAHVRKGLLRCHYGQFPVHHPEVLEHHEAPCREHVNWQRVAAGQELSRALMETRVEAWRNRKLCGRSVYCNCPGPYRLPCPACLAFWAYVLFCFRGGKAGAGEGGR